MASVGRVYISTDNLDRLRAERALCPALRARQPLREQLKSCAACTMPAERCSVDPHSTRHHSPAHSPHSAPSTECGEQASGRCRSKLGSTEHDASSCRFALAKPAPSTETIRSVSGQRRPLTNPSRGRAWVTHTAPKQPSLPSAEDERAAWGPPPAAAARTMPMLRNAFQPFVTQMLSCTSRMSLQL